MEIKKRSCPFADLFGKPNEGIHKPRIFGLAAVDVLLTVLAAKFIAARGKKNFGKVLLQLVAAGIALHRIFGVNTALNEKIFRDKIDCSDEN